ncbi:hypothetical protein [Pontibacter ruber]|uniref:DUF4890 domain-containing protein n=1 Tax=Pontibacter ruber TaxID=1343895 RepID=A0ABW5CUJ8_9BACT|nr:hypothetical protein [Pontibacter ruber]
MKRITLALIFAFVATATFAQNAAKKQTPQTTQSAPKTLEQRADEMTAGMVKHLRLTPDQAKKLKEINLYSMRSAEKAREKYKSDPRQAAQQMDVISQTRLSRIKDILTPQQFAQYQQRREEKMGVPREAQTNPANRQPDQSY